MFLLSATILFAELCLFSKVFEMLDRSFDSSKPHIPKGVDDNNDEEEEEEDMSISCCLLWFTADAKAEFPND